MLEKFKELDKNGQYEIIVQEMKKMDFNAIVIKQLLDNKSNDNIMTKLNDFYKNVYIIKTLIHVSKLSDNFKTILVDEVNDKLVALETSKTRK